jgi:succinate-acetate transporter protein
MAEIRDRSRERYGARDIDEAVIEEAAPVLPVADPAPLGLGAFALATFMLSGHNAGFIPDIAWLGLALFYGGTIQLLAGMWEFRNRNVFGATAFSTYGGFWLGLGSFVVLAELTSLGDAIDNVDNALAWFLISFAIFNTYMLLWSMRVNIAVFGVFLTLEVTEILLAIGFFNLAHGGSDTILKAGGWAGVVTAAVAWYASAAGVVNGMAPKRVVPVGAPFWGTLPAAARPTSPMPRATEG